MPSVTRGDILGRTREEAIDIAKSLVGLRSSYHLGAGGDNPNHNNCLSPQAQCDCSGFVCFCLGLDRYQRDLYKKLGGYLSTAAMVSDANTYQILFRRTAEPKPGDLIIYPSLYNHGRRMHIGHVGILHQLPNDIGPSVIDCNASPHRRNIGSAIGYSSISSWIGKEQWCYLEYLKWSE